MDDDINIELKKLSYQIKLIEAIYYRIAVNLNLSESAFWILYILSKSKQEYSQQAMSRELSISKQTIHSSVQRLVQKGYVCLQQSSDTMRRKNIRLTDKGKLFAEEKIIPLQKAEKEAFLKMGVSDLKCYVSLSQTFTEHLEMEIRKLNNFSQEVSL